MRPLTPIVAAGFFALAALITLAAGLSLLFPGSAFAWMWSIKPVEFAQLQAIGLPASIGFLLLSPIMAAACFGTLGRRRWGWRLALAIFAINGGADAVRLLSGAWLEGGIGVAVTGIILWWLTRPPIRALFSRA